MTATTDRFSHYRYKISSPNHLQTIYTNNLAKARGQLWSHHNAVSGNGIIDTSYTITDTRTGEIITEAGF